MPRRARGAPSQGYAPTNKDLRKGDVEEILTKITDISSVKRQQNDLYPATSLHIDARSEGSWWKVDIQYKNSVMGAFKGKTVATVMVANAAPNASLNDLKEAFREAMRNTTVMEVT